GAAFAVVSAYVRAYAAVIRTVFNVVADIVRAAGAVFRRVFSSDNVKAALHGVQAALVAPFKAAEAIIQGIAHGLESVFDSALSGIKAAINVVIRAFNQVIRGLNRIPKVNIPTIPELSTAAAGSAAAGAVPVARYAAPRVRGATAPAAAAAAPSILIQ